METSVARRQPTAREAWGPAGCPEGLGQSSCRALLRVGPSKVHTPEGPVTSPRQDREPVAERCTDWSLDARIGATGHPHFIGLALVRDALDLAPSRVEADRGGLHVNVEAEVEGIKVNAALPHYGESRP